MDYMRTPVLPPARAFDFVVPTPSVPPTACSSLTNTRDSKAFQFVSRRGSALRTPLDGRSGVSTPKRIPASARDYRAAASWRTANPRQPTTSRVTGSKADNRLSLPAATPRGYAAPTPVYEPHHRFAGDYRNPATPLNPVAPTQGTGCILESAAPSPPPPSALKNSRPPTNSRGVTPRMSSRATPRATARATPQATSQVTPRLPSLETTQKHTPRKLPPTAAIPCMGPTAYMKWIVDGWDQDGDGYIDQHELETGQAHSGPAHVIAGNHRMGGQ